MSYAIQKDSSQVLLRISDELTVADVKPLRDEMLSACSEHLPIVVNARNAKRIDISVVQVLESVYKSLGKLTFQECAPAVAEYLAFAGVHVDRWSGTSLAVAPGMNGADNA